MAANDVSGLNALGGYGDITNFLIIENKEMVWCVFDFQCYGFGFRNSL